MITVVLLGLLASSCAKPIDRTKPNPTPTRSPVPLQQGAPVPEEYTTFFFTPKFRFKAQKAVWVGGGDSAARLWLLARESQPNLILTVAQIQSVIDPSTGQPQPLPEDLDEWVKTHPNLLATSWGDTSVGGAVTSFVDFRVKPDAQAQALLAPTDGTPLTKLPGDKNRLHFLEVGGVRLVIAFQAPDVKFGDFSQKATDLIQTIEFL